LAAKQLNLNVDFVIQEPKRGLDQAENEVIKKLFELPQESTLIVNASGKIGLMNHVGKSFRTFCKSHNHRFISTTSLSTMDTFTIKNIVNALDVDYKKMQEEDKLIKSKIAVGKVMTVKTRAGTNLTIDLNGVSVRSADGNYTKFGTGGNLPAGEVYFAPPKIDGVVVIDASSRNRENAVLIQKPIIIKIENNKITSIEGDEEAKILEESLKETEKAAKHPENVRYLAEFGIGTNLKAKIIGATIVDEKSFGTAHIAIGSNFWFGGKNKTLIHYDQVFKNPRIKIDGEALKF
jgi:leucyl aminopeptidase (aminopeptidase T)